MNKLTLELLISTDDILQIDFVTFSEEIRLDINMKCQALFFSENKRKNQNVVVEHILKTDVFFFRENKT